jgi:uncharacterized membrane protein YedE/YeeE
MPAHTSAELSEKNNQLAVVLGLFFGLYGLVLLTLVFVPFRAARPEAHGPAVQPAS